MKDERSPADPVQDQKKIQNQRTTKWWAIATFFGVGFLKPGPGTWASIVAVLLWFAFAFVLHHFTLPLTLTLALTLALAIAVAIAIGIPAATIVERESGRTDPGFVVIDEVAGQWITLLFSPVDWPHALIALVLFRLFDITKPFPVRRLERLPGGWGIVFDDVAAGLYAFCIASVVRIWF